MALFFDGKTVSVLGKSTNGCEQFDAPDPVDQLLEVLRLGHAGAAEKANQKEKGAI